MWEVVKMKLIICILALIAKEAAPKGNFFACSTNNCENDGQCIPMSTSPTQVISSGSQDVSLSFIHSENPITISEAKTFCASRTASLFTPISPSSVTQAKNYLSGLVTQTPGFEGAWTDLCSDHCKVLALDDKNQFKVKSVADLNSPTFHALCTLSTKVDQENQLIYTCQCPPGYGYENCTKVTQLGTTVNPGYTYCQSEKTEVDISSDPDSIIFIDHVVYGRPFQKTQPDHCKGDLYAKNEDDFCVAYNTLSAVTYWCQGKSRCKFDVSILRNEPSVVRKFYVASLDSKFTFPEAVATCQRAGDSLAELRSSEDAKRIREVVLESFNNGGSSTFWISKKSQKHLGNIGGIFARQSDDDNSCMVIQLPQNVNNSDIYILWKPCFNSDLHYPAICETLPLSRDGISISDLTCLNDVTLPVFEYRFHNEQTLNRRDIACSMKVNFRKGNTCYKTTSILDWRQARNQCWKWGGELAFPLPGGKDCATRTYSFRKEELWIAGPVDCGEERCPKALDDPAFREGSYATSPDLCFPDPGEDPGCKLGSCFRKRKGLCALPPSITNRTPLPVTSNCTKIDSESEGWPYPGYSWNFTGQPGEIVTQKCPAGQNGDAHFECGIDGQWVGYPDLTGCTTIDTQGTIDDLNKETSVPSEVLKNFTQNVLSVDNLASGDIQNIIEVLDVALKAQVDKIVNASDQNSYASSFTTESLNLFNEVLGRQDSWLGIPPQQKRLEVSKIQQIVESASNNLILYSTDNQLNYTGLENIGIKIIKDADFSSGQTFSSADSEITVSLESGGQQSLSFFSYNNLDCLLEDLNGCDKIQGEVDEEDVLNSVVLGASFSSVEQATKNKNGLKVTLTFLHKLDGSQLNLTDQRCSFWDVKKNDWSTDGCSLIYSDEFISKCECDHLTNFGIIMDINGILEGDPINELLSWITLLGCSLSIICLFICVYIFTAIRGLKGDRTVIHRNLCICLLIAEILLVSGLDSTSNTGVCSAVAGFLHFFFLAAFCWMLVEGIHVYLMLVKVFETGRSLIWMFYLVGYGIPCIIVGLSVIIVEATGSHGYGTATHCWLDVENGLIWAFAGPVLIILIANSSMFIIAMNIARKSIQKRQGADNDKIMTFIKGSSSLLCILGITWIFGFTYFANQAVAMAVIFSILNSLQGVFIFLFHVVMNEKAKKEVSRHLVTNLKTLKLHKLAKRLETYSTGTDVSSGHSKATSRERNPKDDDKHKGGDHGRKISMETSMTSVSMSNSKSEPNVKYYRGQVTMTIENADKTTIPEDPDDGGEPGIPEGNSQSPTNYKKKE